MHNLKWLSYTWTRLTKTEQIMLWLLDNVTNHRYASAHTYLLIGSPSFDWQIIACADWQIMCRERCKKYSCLTLTCRLPWSRYKLATWHVPTSELRDRVKHRGFICRSSKLSSKRRAAGRVELLRNYFTC